MQCVWVGVRCPPCPWASARPAPPPLAPPARGPGRNHGPWQPPSSVGRNLPDQPSSPAGRNLPGQPSSAGTCRCEGPLHSPLCRTPPASLPRAHPQPGRNLEGEPLEEAFLFLSPSSVPALPPFLGPRPRRAVAASPPPLPALPPSHGPRPRRAISAGGEGAPRARGPLRPGAAWPSVPCIRSPATVGRRRVAPLGPWP